MKRALFPGSFDPFTIGHQDIVERGIKIFDEIVIGLGINSEKQYMFSLDQRLSFIKACFVNEPRIRVETYKGLTIDFCRDIEAEFILRGVRNNGDFEFEKAIARTNRKLSEIETVFLLTSAQTSYISSSIVRELIRNKGDYSIFIPPQISI
ncbi:MAG: pantetheine-phosphate adenylyltransferase [Flavobacteriaceae bacterium]|nr:pantetheine-phosphate adenylyltransferase [Flavobacteriaceae bacterium]